jgi:hypothetical protein
MSAATRCRHVLSSLENRKLLAKHAAQLLFAIIILGLNANMFQSRADDVLVYSIILVRLEALPRILS